MATDATTPAVTSPAAANAAAPPVGQGPLHALRIGWIRGRLEVKEFFGQRESVVFTLAFPVILLLVFSSVFSYGIGPNNTPFAHYFVPGIIATGLFGVSFQTLAIQIAIERDKGVLKRLEGTPMPPSSYFIGKIIMVLTMVVLETILLLAIAKAMGNVDLPTDWHRWATFVWVMLLGVGAGSLLGISFSSVPRSGKAAPAVITPIALVLQFISGVYFVFTQVNTTLQTVGAVFPLKWIAQGFRSVFLPDTLLTLEPAHQWEHTRTALVLAAWAAGGLLLALRTFRWRARKDA